MMSWLIHQQKNEKTMRASAYIAMSLDGFIARANGDIDFLTVGGSEENEDDYGYKDFIDSVDALVMGRKTFEKVLTFGKWPYENKRVYVFLFEASFWMETKEFSIFATLMPWKRYAWIGPDYVWGHQTISNAWVVLSNLLPILHLSRHHF